MRRAELRDLVVRAFTAAGLLVGLWWGVSVEPGTRPLDPGEAGSASDAFVAGLMPVLVRAGACALAGAVLGGIVALTAPGLRRR